MFTNLVQACLNEMAVWLRPMPTTIMLLSRRRAARRVKSLSEETMTNPSTLPAYRMSIASMMSVESVAFLPAFSPGLWLLTLLNCWTGVMELSSNLGRHLAACGSVKSP